MTPPAVQGLEESRRKLLEAAGEGDDITFIRIHGNLGDELIYAGTRRLLSGCFYREISMRSLSGARGRTALVAGGGSWCEAYQVLPDYLPEVEARFERVIVLPSSFDVRVDRVRDALRSTKALVFARERESFRQIQDLCRADLAHDCALFFDYAPYRRRGKGVLQAFRTDREGLPLPVPPGNEDISTSCESLDEWLWKIARCEEVHTDRAHVTIAAAMLGKRVHYRPSNYHKVPSIIEFSLGGFPVEPLPASEVEDASPGAARHRAGDLAWAEEVRRAAREIASIVPAGGSFILVDDDRLGELPLRDRRPIPFLERGGIYWGAPPDDSTAVRELERLREARPDALVFAWPAFWWLDEYKGLAEHVSRSYARVFANERLVVFDLRRPAAGGA